jgi:pyruvate,water dikinase
MKITERISQKLKRSSRSEEQLRATFKANYFHFKQFLYANRKALEIMAEMEGALFGTQPFGMNAVRTWCTKVSTSVFQIIGSLNKLAPGKYEDLHERFSEIQENIISFIHLESPSREGPLVVSLEEVDKHMADDIGAKMAYLGEIRNRVGLPVPEGFVITASAYKLFLEYNNLQEEISRLIQPLDCPPTGALKKKQKEV